MKKRVFLSSCGTIVLGLFLVGCGSSGSSSTPGVGLGAINEIGVTAIPNTNATAKPMLSRNFIEKGISGLFNLSVANAAVDTCGANISPIIETIPGGAIEIDEAILILDQVEADQQGESVNDIEVGPFALDLLDNDPDAGETISMTLPAGNYEKLKFDFKRIDDNLTAIPTNIQTKLFDGTKERRPSVWIKGHLLDGTTCTKFTFVTDHRWKVTIPFVKSFTGSGGSVDLVVVFGIVDALKAALTNGKTVTDLVAELGVGKSGINPTKQNIMGPEFLDGRTKDDKNHGTPLALAWTNQLPLNIDVFAQNRDDNPNADGTTLVEDSATRISGDDNPSASDLPPTA